MSPLPILATLLVISPLAAPREVLPGWAETPEQRGARYASIAADIAAAVTEACGEKGDGCERWSATLLLGLAWHESGFAPDTDSPEGCYRGRDGKGPRCDGGRAATIFQMQGTAAERALWLGDRKQAAREALRRAVRSWNACKALEPELRLSAYAGGRCDVPEAQKRSRELWAAWQRARKAW